MRLRILCWVLRWQTSPCLVVTFRHLLMCCTWVTPTGTALTDMMIAWPGITLAGMMAPWSDIALAWVITLLAGIVLPGMIAFVAGIALPSYLLPSKCWIIRLHLLVFPGVDTPLSCLAPMGR
jgi:hypothetical protein